jgi:hypothetical protein
VQFRKVILIIASEENLSHNRRANISHRLNIILCNVVMIDYVVHFLLSLSYVVQYTTFFSTVKSFCKTF